MDTAKKLVKLYSKYKVNIILLCIGIPVISQLNIWSQTIFGKIVDSITDVNVWHSLIGTYVAVLIAYFVVKQGYSITEQKLSFKIINNFRLAIAEKVLYIESNALSKYSTDDILQMWNYDTRDIQTLSINTIFSFFILLYSAVLAVITLGTISIYFPVIALVINILSILPVKLIGRKNMQRSQKKRNSQVAMNEKFYRILNAIRLVKSYGKEEREINQFEKTSAMYMDDKLSFFLSSRIYKSVVSALNSIAPTLILIIANYQIHNESLSIGNIVLSISLLTTINQPFSEGGNFIINLKAIGFKFEHLFHFLELCDEKVEGKHLKTASPYSFDFCNVCYIVDGFNLVENISISIASGEKVAVVGESGSGKTTLNNLILRLYDPSDGTILLNGTDIHKYDLYEYRKGIHYSLSNIYICAGTIMKNITLLGADEEKCVQIAKAIDFHNEILSMADGYHTVIDASGSNISGGQKKKIAIIRALAQHRSLYVLDEITRGIDESASLSIMNYLLENIKSTAVFTMHNLDAIERMDKIIVMKSGQIIDVGKHGELFQRCGYYQELYNNGRRDDNE